MAITHTALRAGKALCLAVLFALAFPLHDGKSAQLQEKNSPETVAVGEAVADLTGELRQILAAAKEWRKEEDGEKHSPGPVARFCDWLERAEGQGSEYGNAVLAKAIAEASEDEAALLNELKAVAQPVRQARAYARSVLSNSDYREDRFLDLTEEALNAGAAAAALEDEAAELITECPREAARIRELRDEVLGKFHDEARRGKVSPTIRLAWGMIRTGAGDPETQLLPETLKYNSKRVGLSLVRNGVPIRFDMKGADFEKRVRASAYGYTFTAGWALLFQKPIAWMALTAQAMQQAGVDPKEFPEWEVMEGPGGLIAIASAASPSPKVFYQGKLYGAEKIPAPAGAARMAEEFYAAAKALHEGVMADDSISRPLRQAMNPILAGTYLPVDSRDYFDSAFCRRLIEADYLEVHIKPLPPELAGKLAAYRAALGKVEAGFDEFAADLSGGRRLVAVSGEDAIFSDGTAEGRRDMETGETVSRYTWRLEEPDETVFFSPLPARYVYALSLAERYPGRHLVPPPGVPERTEVWHAVLGRIAWFEKGDERASGDPKDWSAALTVDAGGRTDNSSGPVGWNFPMHVLQRDDQGDPVALAVPGGVVPSPNFTRIPDPAERRRAEDAWLDGAARVLSTPGELGLIFHQFFRYCSDSPLPERPNLIGSHYGLSDTHQTVYQSLERRWVGRLIGDCDDLAEFFQVLTRRQGKLSHVMQLPAHAAAGYAERTEEGDYRFVVLQTGPVLRFAAPTLYEAVEKAYRHFDDDGGQAHLTAAAVPLLLRFADEETRTPFVLSARIYEDRDYAEAMIRVQGYWHTYTFSAAIREMEEMLETDREVGSIKELASLYERVGRYEESAELRREELAAVEGDGQATFSALLDIAHLHIQDKNRPAALAALAEMETLLKRQFEEKDVSGIARSAAFRHQWAIQLSRLGEPARAWNLVRKEVAILKRGGGRIPESMFRTLVAMYDKMSLALEHRSGGEPDPRSEAARRAVGKEIEGAIRRGFFKPDDSYTTALSRYFVLGRYAVAEAGRGAGLERLRRDGPYPEGPRDHSQRGRELDESDWEWFRIVPQLYLVYGLEMLDRDEYPELYNPEAAKPILEDVARAVEKGGGLGSDVAGGDDLIKSALLLSFLNRDLDAFNRTMLVVRDKNYSSLYDDAAVVFGQYCGLLPIQEFPAWVEAFHRFFPGRQNYFKAVYLALDKEHFDHAMKLAEATARFFPEDKLLVDEAAYVEKAAPELKRRRAEQREKNRPVEPEKIEARAEGEARDAA